MFRKTPHNRIFQDLVEQIQGAILDGRLKPGDRLPSQRELGEMFQTSRASLREALRVLEQKGLIEMKLGVSGGAVVKDASTKQITETLSLLMQHQKVSFNHLAEFREGVEGCVAALAAERATKKDILQLKELLDEARKLLEEGNSHIKDFFQNDIKMHIALAAISGNPVYIAVLRMVHENILGSSERFSFRDEQGLRENYQALCDIVRAVEQRQATKARSLAQNHIAQCTRYMKKEQQKQDSDH